MAKNNYCYECGAKLIMKGDPENGPQPDDFKQAPVCPSDPEHVPLEYLISEAEGAVAEDLLGVVTEYIEKALETTTEDDYVIVVLRKDDGSVDNILGPMTEAEALDQEPVEGTTHLVTPVAVPEAGTPAYQALRQLRKTIIEGLAEMPESMWDAHAAAGNDSDAFTGARAEVEADDPDDYEEPSDGDPDSAMENAAQRDSVERDMSIYGDSKREQEEGRRYEAALTNRGVHPDEETDSEGNAITDASDWKIDESEGNNE